MPSPIHLERRWLMDIFGRFVQYDSMSRQLVTTAFTPQSFPNLFTFVPAPEQLPHRAMLRLVNSVPTAIPPTRFVKPNNFGIAIQNLETQEYLCAPKECTKTYWQNQTNTLTDFMLLSPEMIIGLSLLSDSDLTLLSNEEEDILSNLTFTNEANCAKISGQKIRIFENLSEISKLSKCKAHEEIELSFQKLQDQTKPLTIKILPKRSLKLASYFLC